MRLPFEGVAALYRALQQGSDGRRHNPIFYLSGGPWNLYDIYHDFLEFQGIPAGPLLLADFGFEFDKLIHPPHEKHKGESIDEIFATYPELRFVLIGDSGEHDPEIYVDAAERYPGRVIVIYIRNAGGRSRRNVEELTARARAAGAGFVMKEHSDEAWADALARGLIVEGPAQPVAQAGGGRSPLPPPRGA
jgi:phosphatidate phosphatase APP1